MKLNIDENCSIVLDCTDNFESRIIMSKFCHNKKILVSSDILAFAHFSLGATKKSMLQMYIFPNLFNFNENYFATKWV